MMHLIATLLDMPLQIATHKIKTVINFFRLSTAESVVIIKTLLSAAWDMHSKTEFFVVVSIYSKVSNIQRKLYMYVC